MTKAERHLESTRLFQEASALEDQGKTKEAIKIYTASARLGNDAAQSNLGNLLDDKVRPPRRAQARYWYKRAVRAGSYVAAWNLAMHYKTRKIARWHMHWLQTAAAMGDPDAKAELKKFNAARPKTLQRSR